MPRCRAIVVSDNPYLSPIEPEGADGLGSFRTNEQHHKRIREIRSIALFYYLLAAGVAICGVCLWVQDADRSSHVSGLILFTCCSAGFVLIGKALKRGRQWARYFTILFSVPCLFAFPVGTVLGFHVLSTLLSQEAKDIFAQPSREVSLIESTARTDGGMHPLIKTLLYILLAVVLLLLLPAFLLSLFG